mmetsp:Transcript_139908/g.243683  ORF Transcript_139908/g.243683 Transcript_139908/m.243683 type:complete len:207 (-) Transcript_139908:176-796(-)
MPACHTMSFGFLLRPTSVHFAQMAKIIGRMLRALLLQSGAFWVPIESTQPAEGGFLVNPLVITNFRKLCCHICAEHPLQRSKVCHIVCSPQPDALQNLAALLCCHLVSVLEEPAFGSRSRLRAEHLRARQEFTSLAWPGTGSDEHLGPPDLCTIATCIQVKIRIGPLSFLALGALSQSSRDAATALRGACRKSMQNQLVQFDCLGS